MDKIYDLIIIGGGPAGLSAAIYAQRAKLETLVLEASYVSGGQMVNTYEVDNYPGMPGVSGMDLGNAMREHADRLGCRFSREKVLELQLEGEIKGVRTRKGDYQAKSLILATGASHRKLQVAGEEEFSGLGVSYCATCDGAFFKDKVTAVVGGGDVAVEDAIFLARLCKKVYLIHRRDSLRAAALLQDHLMTLPNVEIIWNSVVTALEGKDQLDHLQVVNTLSQQKSRLQADGCFIAVGIQPNNQLFLHQLKLDQGGYIEAGEDGITSLPGVFAAGDIRTKQLRQIITAAADGANCVTSVQSYLLSGKTV